MKLTWRKKRIIKEHLEWLEKHSLKNKLPEEYHGYNGVTQIRYGYMGRKMITPDMIEYYKNILESKYNKIYTSW